MKKTLLLLILFSVCHLAKASDTLTIRQVFNFDVGDTFDYAYRINFGFSTSASTFSRTYSRFIIIAKTTSAGNDSITYIRQQLYPVIAFDTLVYTHLDSSIFEIFDTVGISQYLTVYTGHYPDGRLTDSLIENVPLTYGSFTAKYGEGLGKTYSHFSSTDGSSYSINWDTTLIYYSKNSGTFGTHYYELLEPNYAHFTPIPEECAFWNYCGYASEYNDLYQVRTGSKIYYNNHTYVELLFRSFVNGILHTDSTVGFFRNDTAEQKVYFTLQPGSNESVLYDFTYTNTQVMVWNYSNASYFDTSVSSVNFGSTQRSKWDFNTLCTCSPGPETIKSTTIEGVGALIGFFHSPGSCFYRNGQPYTMCSPELQFFCICGQSIYQSNNRFFHLDTISGQCALLVSISNINSNNSIDLYPSPTSGVLHLSFAEINQHNTHLTLTNLLGQQVYSFPISETETTHDISKLPSGIYTWRLVSDNAILKTGKIVKQ